MKRIIKILPAEGTNPEFAPDKEEQEGFECDGYLLLTFTDEELHYIAMSGISTRNLTDAVKDNIGDEVIAIMRQAFAVAEGYIRASEIFAAAKRDKKIDLLRKIFEGEDEGEDE